MKINDLIACLHRTEKEHGNIEVIQYGEFGIDIINSFSIEQIVKNIGNNDSFKHEFIDNIPNDLLKSKKLATEVVILLSS